MSRRDIRWHGVSKAALRAAEKLGDEDAREELNNMAHRTFWALVVTLVIGAVVAVMLIGLQACESHEQAAKEAELIRVKSSAELAAHQQADAAALRLRYVERCLISPAQAEQLIQPGPAQDTR